MKRILMLMMLLSACSALPVKDYCIENAPGISKSLINGDGLSSGFVALAIEGSASEEAKNIASFLQSEGISAVFFIDGKSISDSTDKYLKDIHALGQTIGNRSFTGKLLTETSDFTSEIRLTDALISPFITNNVFLLRPPENAFSDDIANRLNREGLSKYVGPIGYNQENLIDMECWNQELSVDQCSSRYLEQIQSEGRGLFALSSNDSRSLDLLAKLIPQLRQNGFEFATITDIPDILVSARNNGATPNQDPPSESCNDYD